MIKSCKYGSHRVISPLNSLPQAADKIDPTPIPFENEILIDVDVLNIDSASFHQIKEACNHDEEAMKKMIIDIVNTKGKMQNPVTKSGGMLIGKVKAIGEKYSHPKLKVGTMIASLVSLSLTPLTIEKIIAINLTNEQVKIKGQAILFDSGIYAVIPKDFDERLALAALDVAGAPAQIKKLAKENDTVFIIGAAGKSGLLSAFQAKESVGSLGKVIGLVNEQKQLEELQQLGIYDHLLLLDAKNPLEVYQAVHEITNGFLADLTVNVVNVENTEMASIMATKDLGIVYFFSMATSFTKAALGAEGIGKDVTMIIGNGYTLNHAEITLDLLRKYPQLKAIFIARYT